MNILRTARENTFFNNSFFIFTTRFFPSMANLVVLLLYARNLSPAVYGAYQNFWIQLNIIYPIAAFGIHAFIITYKPAATLELARSIKPVQYALFTIWGMALAGIFALLQASSNGLSFIISVAFLLCFAASIVIESFLMACKAFSGLSVISILYSVAFVGTHWYLLYNNLSLQTLFTYLLILCVAKLGWYIILLIQNIKKQSISAEEVSIDSARSLWLHMGLYDVVQVLFNWIDKFIISFLLTASVSAVYFNGAMNIPFLPLLLSAASSSILIQLADKEKSRSTTQTTSLVNHASRLLSCIVFPLFFFLLFYRQELFALLFAGKYAASVPIFLMSIIVIPLRAYGFTAVLQSYHKGAVINLGSILDLLLACALMYPLYLCMGLPGVALSFAISTYLQSTFYLYHTAKVLNVGMIQLIPLGNWLVKLLIFGALLGAVHFLCTEYFAGVFSLVLGGGTMTIIMLVSLGVELKAERRKHGTTT